MYLVHNQQIIDYLYHKADPFTYINREEFKKPHLNDRKSKLNRIKEIKEIEGNMPNDIYLT